MVSGELLLAIDRTMCADYQHEYMYVFIILVRIVRLGNFIKLLLSIQKQ